MGGPSLRGLVGQSRYIMVVGVFCLLAGAIEATAWGAIHVVQIGIALWHNERYATGVVGLLHLLDAFLVAPVLLIVAIGTFELFVAPLNVPDVLKVSSLHALKVRFASMLVLILSVTFVEHVISWDDPMSTLVIGIAIALVSGTLIAYSRWAEH